MRNLVLGPITCLIFALTVNTAQADTILFEDFEDASVLYTTSHADQFSDVNSENYFGRVGSGGGSLPASGDISYNNLQGTGFYTAHDTDSAGSGNVDLITMNFTGINISNFTSMNLSFLVAEDDADDGNEDWDITTSMRIAVQVDGGGFVQFFGIEGTDAVSGNKAAHVDTNLDGVGDGAEITDVFTSYGFDVADGSSLDIRISIEDLDTGDEDIAFDNILLTGTFTGVPEPTALMLFATGLGMCVSRRRRK